MNRIVLQKCLDGLFSEVTTRELELDRMWTFEQYYYRKYPRKGYDFYARAVELIREVKRLRKIITEVSFLLLQR